MINNSSITCNNKKMSSQHFPKLGSSHRGPSIFSLLSWTSIKEYEYTMSNLRNLIKPTINITKEEDVTHFMQDKSDVIKLPAIVETPSKSSGRLERYKRRREKEYAEVIDDMKQQMENENIEVSDKIRCQADFIKREISDTDERMASIVLATEFNKSRSLNISVTEFRELYNKLYDLQIDKRRKIRYHYNFLKKAELDRTAVVNRILKNTYQHLIKTSHKTPYEIESFIESQIQKINGITMSNLRHYSDLVYQLFLYSENTMFHYIHQVQMNKEKWLKYNTTMAVLRLNKEKLAAGFMQTFDKETNIIFQDVNTLNDAFIQTYYNLSVLYLTQDEYEQFACGVKKYLNDMSDQTKKIIDAFKLTISKIFIGYFESWENLQNGIIKKGELTEIDLRAIKLQFMMPAIETADKKFKVKLDKLKTSLSDIQMKLSNKFNDALDFLKNCSIAWQRYMQNLEQASYLVITEFALKIMANNDTMKTFRVKLNTLLDDLRQAPTKEKLDIYLTNIFDFLDKMKNQHKVNSKNEEIILCKYKTYANDAIDILIKQLEEILFYKPEDEAMKSTKMRPRASKMLTSIEEINEEQQEELICPIEIKMCEYQINALNNWCEGFREMVTNYIKTCRGELLETAEIWISNMQTRNNIRAEIQLTYLNLSYEEIKEDIYHVRKMEIRRHAKILERHLGGIQNNLNKLSECYEFHEVKNKKIYETVKEDIKKISEQYLTINKTTDANLHCAQLKNISQIYDDNLQILTDDLNKNLQMIYYKIVKSGQKLRKSITLFSEDGNFHNEEINNFLKVLKAAEKGASKKFKSFSKECQKKFKIYKIDFDKVYANVERKLITIRGELKMRDDTVIIIKKLQFDIRTKAYKFKYNYKKLLAFYQDFLQKYETFLGNPESIVIIKTLINDIIVHTEEFYLELLIPNDILRESKKILSELQSTDNSSSSKQNLLLFLYEMPPTKIEKSFMSEIANKIYDTYNTLRTNAKAFYENNPVLMSENKLKPTFNGFMAEIIDRFKYYHAQCEPLWIEQAKCFTKLITEFEAFMREFKATFCETFGETQFNKGVAIQSKARRSLKTVRTENYESFKKIHNQLKPLHGHPNNKHLLKEIDDKMQEELRLLSTKTSEEVAPLKEEYFSNREYLHEMLPFIEEELNKVVASLEYKEKYGIFLKQYEEKVAFLTELVNNENNDEVSPSVKLSRSDVCVQIMNKVAAESLTSRDNVTEIASNHSNVWNRMSTYNNHTEICKKPISVIIEEYDDSFAKFQKEIEIVVKKSQMELDEWHKIWLMDIERVLKLYSVKYDIRKEK